MDTQSEPTGGPAASRSSGNRLKRTLFAASVSALAIILLLISGEIGIRVYQSFKYHQVHPGLSPIRLDEDLGWIPNPDYNYEGFRLDAGGKRYFSQVRNDQNGFRLYGNPDVENRIKVMFIGDSFTHALEVSCEKAYFGILKERFPLEVFALGVGGYGSLQEYMILDEYIDAVRPDIVILQMHTNDFINNYYELELESKRNNNGLRRPYLSKDGHIRYAIPKKHSHLRDIVNKHSRFIYFVMSRLDILQAREGSVEDGIREKGMSVPSFRESVEITEKLLRMIKSRIPAGTDLYVFCADGDQPSLEELKRILKKNDITFIGGVAEAISDAERHGITVRAADGAHWNEEGHRIAAGVLERYFSDKL